MATLTVEERKERARLAKAARAQGVTPGAGFAQSVKEGSELQQRLQEEDAALSIIKKAVSISTPSTLIFGNAGSGKSTLVLETLLKANRKPLWLPLNNNTVLADPRAANWDVALPTDWDEFVQGIYAPAMRGQLTGYDTLVIDGLNFLTMFRVNKEAPGGQAGLQEWLVASNKLRDTLVKLREKFGSLYAVVDVVPDKKSGGRKIDLNPYTANILIPLFGAKWYTHIVKDRDANNKLTGGVTYTVQRNPALALDFTLGEKFTIDTL